MVKKLKIPTSNLKIVAGPYKGYNAEYRQRIRQGEFLYVIINATGEYATIPIGNIVFMMDDGKILKYINIQDNLVLGELGKEEAGEIKVAGIDETIQAKEMVEFLNDITTDSDPETDEEMEIDEDTPEASFANLQHVQKKSTELDTHPVTGFLQEFFEITGFDMDKSSVNKHSKSLQGYLKKIKNTVFNENLYKTFVMAYIFIFVNNMNIGYPVAGIKGCRIKPNDDPRYIVCVAVASGFVDPPDPDSFNINSQIKMLLKTMGTSIIPSDVGVSIVRDIKAMKINNNSKPKQVVIPRTDKKQRFPILDTSQIEKDVRNFILNKVRTIPEFTHFVDNFDSYIKGPLFAKLNTNPNLPESKMFMPFIKEYKERLAFEEDKLYQKKPRQIRITDPKNIRRDTINSINKKIKKVRKDNNLPEIKDNALRYVQENHMDIIKYTRNEIESMKLSLNTSTEADKEIINSIILYRKLYNDLLKQRT